MSSMVITISNIRSLIKAYKKIKQYLHDDYEAWLALEQPIHYRLKGRNIGLYTFIHEDAKLQMLSNKDKSILDIYINDFEAWLKIWNGVSLLPDEDDGGYEASVVHDAVDHYLEPITESNMKVYPDMPRKKLRRAIRLHYDKILVLIWRYAAKQKGKNMVWINFKTWAILNGLYVAPRDAWSNAMNRIVVFLLLCSVAFTGCARLDDSWEVIHLDDVKFKQGATNETMRTLSEDKTER